MIFKKQVQDNFLKYGRSYKRCCASSIGPILVFAFIGNNQKQSTLTFFLHKQAPPWIHDPSLSKDCRLPVLWHRHFTSHRGYIMSERTHLLHLWDIESDYFYSGVYNIKGKVTKILDDLKFPIRCFLCYQSRIWDKTNLKSNSYKNASGGGLF